MKGTKLSMLGSPVILACRHWLSLSHSLSSLSPHPHPGQSSLKGHPMPMLKLWVSLVVFQHQGEGRNLGVRCLMASDKSQPYTPLLQPGLSCQGQKLQTTLPRPALPLASSQVLAMEACQERGRWETGGSLFSVTWQCSCQGGHLHEGAAMEAI